MAHPDLERLASLRLPIHDHVLFGSGSLLVRSWIEDAGDLDVIARWDAWDLARRLGPEVHLSMWDVTVVQIGNISIGTRWAIGDPDPDELIDNAELIAGFPCARLTDIVAYKRLADRPKDRVHLEMIAARS